MQTRTRRQKEILDFISRYLENHGYEPSYQTIARHFGLRSKAGIAKHIAALESHGLLRRRHENGSFKLELTRSEMIIGAAFEIGWLRTDFDAVELEAWENHPVSVPEFMLGGLSPADVCVFRAGDNAMSGRNICSGDVILIERRDFVRDGACVVASVKKTGVFIREYHRDGAKIELRSANESFEPIRIFADEMEIHGIFRGLLRPIC